MRTHLLGGLLPLLLWGCAADADWPRPPAGARVPLEVSGSVGTLTRATGDKWEAGDEIGLFMLRAGGPLAGGQAVEGAFNRRYGLVADERFAPATPADTIWFPHDPEEKVDLIAYHPYAAAVDADEPLLPIDLTDPAAPADILYADRVEGRDAGDPHVRLAFRHAMSRVTVDLRPGEGTSAADLEGASFRLSGQYARGVCYLADGSTRAAGDTCSLSFAGHAAILLPSDGGAGRVLRISLPALGKELDWPLPDGKRFAPGEQTAYHVTVSRKPGPDPEPDPDPGPEPEPPLGLRVTAEVVNWLPGNGGGESGSAE